jgi:hypothetical protein
MSLRVRFTLRAEPSLSDPKTTVPHLICMQIMDDDVVYAIPDEFKSLTHHEELFTLPSAIPAKRGLTPRWTRRILKITLPENIARLYADEEGNAVFRQAMLSEYVESVSSASSTLPPSPVIVRAQSENPRSLSSLVKDMVLSKFGGKSQHNPEAWIDTFELECSRVGIEKNCYWQTLRPFLEDSQNKWYNTLQQTTRPTSWDVWRGSFLENFGQNSLAVARHAFIYRHIAGSISDYVQTKHNLLVSFNPLMHEKDKIIHIVLGLPFAMQNRLNLSGIGTVGKLITTINSLAVTPPRSILNQSSSMHTTSPASSAFSSLCQKSHCSYCLKKGFERSHSEKDCFTKFKDNRDKNRNQNSNVKSFSPTNVEKAIHTFDLNKLEEEINEIQKNE